MGELSAGRRPDRDAAGLVGDAVMSSLEDLVERLRDDPPRPPPPAPAAADPGAAGRADASPASHLRALPARAAADLLGALVAEIVPAVLDRIDPDALLDRVDVQRIVERGGLEAVVRRIDLDDLARRIDLDALLADVDLDALVRRVDLTAATREALEGADIGAVIRESSATLSSDVVENLRAQAMRADDLVARLIDRALRRSSARETSVDAARRSG